MKRKSKPQKVETMKFFLYRGFFHCGECGFTITADKKIKKKWKILYLLLLHKEKSTSQMHAKCIYKRRKNFISN